MVDCFWTSHRTVVHFRCQQKNRHFLTGKAPPTYRVIKTVHSSMFVKYKQTTTHSQLLWAVLTYRLISETITTRPETLLNIAKPSLIRVNICFTLELQITLFNDCLRKQTNKDT